uniref:Uncharacterized protein n=1 Tax=Setaria viridis TaxID=4556 RepID=A0A4U6W597_SETVI|nr:hypothetical protein SEVIR_1G006800v2 [Setaria viridis]
MQAETSAAKDGRGRGIASAGDSKQGRKVVIAIHGWDLVIASVGLLHDGQARRRPVLSVIRTGGMAGTCLAALSGPGFSSGAMGNATNALIRLDCIVRSPSMQRERGDGGDADRAARRLLRPPKPDPERRIRTHGHRRRARAATPGTRSVPPSVDSTPPPSSCWANAPRIRGRKFRGRVPCSAAVEPSPHVGRCDPEPADVEEPQECSTASFRWHQERNKGAVVSSELVNGMQLMTSEMAVAAGRRGGGGGGGPDGAPAGDVHAAGIVQMIK